MQKILLARNELEYIGFRITKEGIIPLSYKLEATISIAVPPNRKQFLVLINYYRDMW